MEPARRREPASDMTVAVDDDDDDVAAIMAAKEAVAPLSFHDRLGDSAQTAMAAAFALSPVELDKCFVQAELFASVVQSRLEQDAASLEPRLWEFQAHTARLWALRQQATLGSCDVSRGSKEYSAAAHERHPAATPANGFVTWPLCCFRMTGESKLKLWQDLGDMGKHEAQARFVGIVTALAPDWSSPLATDSALLRTWAPDDESDRCTICDEVFTFLNRRHHCRRCSNLVCAVCSPHTRPLRVFTQASQKPQRICTACVHEMETETPVRPVSLVDANADVTGTGAKPVAPVESGPMPTASVSPEGEDKDRENSSVAESLPSESSLLLPHAVPPRTRFPETLPRIPALLNASSTVAASTIHCGILDFLHGAGFRKTWNQYFFVLLIRKGSLGMFLNELDHIEKKKRPSAVYKLSGYTIRVKSQKRRPHQFRLTHAAKKPLHFAATSIEEMNLWISQLSLAIDNANDLEEDGGGSSGGGDERNSTRRTTGGGTKGRASSQRRPENEFLGNDNDEIEV